MESRKDDELGNLVEAQLDVGGRSDELGGVNHAAFKCGVDICGRYDRGRSAEFLENVGPGAGSADFHTLEIGQTLHLTA